MNKTSNSTSTTFKLFNNKSNKQRCDTATSGGNNVSMIKNDIK